MPFKLYTLLEEFYGNEEPTKIAIHALLKAITIAMNSLVIEEELFSYIMRGDDKSFRRTLEKLLMKT